MRLLVILHNIRSSHNVGAIFRTADGAGVSKIYLTGYTPAPVDRFGRIDPSIKKTALGAIDSIPWESLSDVDVLLNKLKAEKVHIVAVEQHGEAKEYKTWNSHTDAVFIFGNEIDGVPVSICNSADTILHIPMHGLKESLNVSVAAGIILFHAKNAQTI